MRIEAKELQYSALNDAVRSSKDRSVEIFGCIGQRYLGAGLSDKDIVVHGTPGNALGAYLSG